MRVYRADIRVASTYTPRHRRSTDHRLPPQRQVTLKITIHIGLHKSGTTTLQTAWRAAFSSTSDPWFPAFENSTAPGHHETAWTIAATQRGSIDLGLEYSRLLDRGVIEIEDVVSEARSNGVEHLLISSEEISRITASEGARLKGLLDSDDVTILLTITRPVHRWYSAWQELVKAGLAETPEDSEDKICIMTLLEDGRLEALLRAIPADRVVVRIVRTDPYEPDFAGQVSSVLGIYLPESPSPHLTTNTSFGANVELLRRLNAANEPITIDPSSLQARLRELEHPDARHSTDFSTQDGYDLPQNFAEIARAEQRLLRHLDEISVIELHDPHEQLSRWDDVTPPRWVEEITQRSWPIVIDSSMSSSDLAWRARIVLACNKRNHAEALDRLALQMASQHEELVRALQHSEAVEAELVHAAQHSATLEADNAEMSYRSTRLTEELEELRPYSERPSLAIRVFFRNLWPALRSRILGQPD
jgi:hypothetical protein